MRGALQLTHFGMHRKNFQQEIGRARKWTMRRIDADVTVMLVHREGIWTSQGQGDLFFFQVYETILFPGGSSFHTSAHLTGPVYNSRISEVCEMSFWYYTYGHKFEKLRMWIWSSDEYFGYYAWGVPVSNQYRWRLVLSCSEVFCSVLSISFFGPDSRMSRLPRCEKQKEVGKYRFPLPLVRSDSMRESRIDNAQIVLLTELVRKPLKYIRIPISRGEARVVSY